MLFKSILSPMRFVSRSPGNRVSRYRETTHSSSLASNFLSLVSQVRDRPLNFSESGSTITDLVNIGYYHEAYWWW